MLDRNNFHFSFSGLKTALLYQVQRDKEWKRRIPEYAHEFQQAVIDVLVHKTIRAAENYNVNTIFLAGGVSANQELRKQMRLSITEQIPDSNFLIPDLAYCTDNAAMVAAAGYFKARDKKYTPWQKLSSDCTWEL